ncbi:MAG: hypothetical protein KKH94_04170 [Candidatus Omnitrophica bacterium]|nr:hypothetical protein [Candidatus Omnitrophota bacterium]
MNCQTLQKEISKENVVSTTRVLSDIDTIIKAFEYFKGLIEENQDDSTMGAECTKVLGGIKAKIIDFAYFVSLFINRYYSANNSGGLSHVWDDAAEFTCFTIDLLNVETKEEVAS